MPKNNNNINEDNNQKEINENYYNDMSNQNQNIPKENTNNINDINDNKNKTISISREEYEEFLKYKEMKKQKS